MEAFILGILGPYANLALAVALAAVVFARKSIRRRHIVMLLVVTVTSFVAFFALLLWSFTWSEAQKSGEALHVALKLLAAATVGCGAAVGFSLVLKSLGLASLSDGKPAP